MGVLHPKFQISHTYHCTLLSLLYFTIFIIHLVCYFTISTPMYPVLFLNSLTLLLPSIMYLFVVHYLPPRSINMHVPQYLIWVHFLLLVYYFTTYLQDQLSCTWSPSYWKGMTGCRGSPLVWWWVGAGSKGMPPRAPDRWLTALSVYPPYKIHIASVDIFIRWLSTLLNF